MATIIQMPQLEVLTFEILQTTLPSQEPQYLVFDYGFAAEYTAFERTWGIEQIPHHRFPHELFLSQYPFNGLILSNTYLQAITNPNNPTYGKMRFDRKIIENHLVSHIPVLHPETTINGNIDNTTERQHQYLEAQFDNVYYLHANKTTTPGTLSETLLGTNDTIECKTIHSIEIHPVFQWIQKMRETQQISFELKEN